MMLFKDKLTLAIAEAAQAVLDESAFDDAALKWADQADEKDIKGAIDSFKQLKARSLLKGAEADISPWIKKRFADFTAFIDSKFNILKKKDIDKETEKDVEHVFENNLVTIVSPNTYEASKKYGANTKWCISGRDRSHWDRYINSHLKIYFIIAKTGSKKLAVITHPKRSDGHETLDDKNERVSESELNNKIKQYQIPKDIVEILYSNKIDWNKWLKNIGGIKNSDGTVDVKGDVVLTHHARSKGLGRESSNFPFEFRHVGGSFSCDFSGLTSLKGAPITVGGDFKCDYNKLTSLEGAPKSVEGNFDCEENRVEFTVKQVKAVSKVKGEINV